MKRVTDFGEPDDSDSESEEDKEEDEYNEDFETDQLTRITKLAGLSQNMQIYPKQDLPLMFRSSVGALGKIEIYIKSKAQVSDESRTIDSEDEDDY